MTATTSSLTGSVPPLAAGEGLTSGPEASPPLPVRASAAGLEPSIRVGEGLSEPEPGSAHHTVVVRYPTGWWAVCHTCAWFSPASPPPHARPGDADAAIAAHLAGAA